MTDNVAGAPLYYNDESVDRESVDGESVDESGGSYPFWLMLLLGITSVVFGVAVLVWPDSTVRVLGVLVGFWLLVSGAARIVSAFASGRGLGRQLLSGIVGVILVVAGLACLRDVAKGVLVFAFMISLTWMLSGIAAVVSGIGASGAARVGLIILGLLSVVVGLVFMLWPSLSLAVFVIMTGIGALVVGIGEIVIAFQLRRIGART
jgi:uncharacterized membrane protein HdeD (DUF308 family)